MKLKEIKIENYRSIESKNFIVEENNGSQTFALIGINESGKTSFLNAISLVDEGDISFPKDFFNENLPIEIFLKYELSQTDISSLHKELEANGVDKEVISKIEIESIDVGVTFKKEDSYTRKNFERINLKTETIESYHLAGNTPQKKTEGLEVPDLNLRDLFKVILPEYFYKKSHHITFWKSDPRHLISEKINLETFSTNPKQISVPLYNCFNLAGIDDIASEINAIKTDSARRQNLVDRLGDSVTDHVKKVWPNHAVIIKFNIDAMILEFLIEDDKVKYKTKTTSQRSDGFKQFISFLLTISAEHSNESLSRSLLLLDEPETHLHPRAQEYLKDELIKITKNTKNNIVFFATHSSYMIDKNNIERCYKVEKVENLKTEISKITGSSKTYAEVNYEVFDVTSSDYHNQLYGKIQDDNLKYTEKEIEEFLIQKGIKQLKDYVKVNKDGTLSPSYKITIHSYIRNLIHHPENTNNKVFTESELRESIKTLISLTK